MSFFNNNFLHVVENGSYAYPAKKRYHADARVQCDRCLKTNLTACIGYQNTDLCLECVQKIIEQQNGVFPRMDSVRTRMETMRAFPQITTNMEKARAFPPQLPPFAPKPDDEDPMTMTFMEANWSKWN